MYDLCIYISIQRTDGMVDRSIFLCNLCNKEYLYCPSSSSLKYHLNAKYLGANMAFQLSTAPDASVQSNLVKPHPTRPSDPN